MNTQHSLNTTFTATIPWLNIMLMPPGRRRRFSVMSPQRLLWSFLFVLSISIQVAAQAGGAPAPNQAAGTSTGSYALSNFDNVNLYNGNLNFSLPLLKIGGRGSAQVPINLNINSTRWKIGSEMFGGGVGSPMGCQTVNGINACNVTVTVTSVSYTTFAYNISCPPLIPCTFNLATLPFFISHYVLDGTPIMDAPGPPAFSYYYVEPEVPRVNPGYGPGVMQARTANRGGGMMANPNYVGSALTRMVFTSPDGAEHEMVDQKTGGQLKHGFYAFPFNRGKSFASRDGSNMLFVSDTDIIEYFSRDEVQPVIANPTGYLTLSDGTKYRIREGLVDWVRDRNGNTLTFTYGTDPDNEATYRQVLTITDSLGRVVRVAYRVVDPATNSNFDRITYDVSAGETRDIKVWRGRLDSALRRGYAIETYGSLFAGYQQEPIVGTTYHNPDNVVSAVELPDGRKYELRYNPYNDLAEVSLPTGGVIDYDYVFVGNWRSVSRRLNKRRVYGSNIAYSPELTQTYAAEYGNNKTTVTVQQNSWGLTRSKDKHYFHGDATAMQVGFYSPWRDGLEYQADTFDSDGTTLLRSAKTLWEQRAPVSWYPQDRPDTSPPNYPRVKSVTTELHDAAGGAIAAKKVFGYDESSPTVSTFNNQTDVWEYAFGAPAPSGTPTPGNTLLRHTRTDFLITGTGVGPTPTPIPSPGPSPTPPDDPPECRCNNRTSSGATVEEYFRQNLIRLPAETRVYGVVDNQEQLQARTEYVYDETVLLPRSGITGWTDPGSLARGNLTTTKSWINPVDENAFVKASAKYDQAGNVTEITDANNKVTTIEFQDCFGFADGNARDCTLRQTYALPTRVTNAMGHVTYTKYDYYSGAPVTAEDANGVKANMLYNDLLGRITQVVSAAGTSLQRQTSFIYNDTARTITTTSDLIAFADNKLKSESIYDGLGRTTETRSYESDGGFIVTRQFYDGLGRVSKTTNPYRTTSDPTYGEIERKYDALGRVAEVRTTSDGAKGTTLYAGNTATTTDPTGRQRKTVTDSLGRLVSVFEAPNLPDVNYETRYQYDGLDNLIKAVQGPQNTTSGQIRAFVYDGLSRMTAATNPESGTTSYRYDPNGNVIEKVDPRLGNDQITHYKAYYYYDPLNRLTKRIYNDGTPEVNYFYDAQTLPEGAPNLEHGASIGKLLAVTYGASPGINGTYYGYDAVGRVIKSAQVTDGQTFPTMEYGYSLSSSMTRQKYPSGREVTTTYDQVGRFERISGQRPEEEAKTYVSSPEYAAHGTITALKLGNGLWERTSFNSRLQPTEIKLGTQNNPEGALKLTYTYGTTDNNGNVRSQRISVPGMSPLTQTYTYDVLNRLLVANETGGADPWQQYFGYDRFGNRRFRPEGTNLPAVLNNTNNATISEANNRMDGYSYDLAGNVTLDALNGTYAYDGDSLLVRYNGGANPNTGGADYAYDGDGRRVKKVTGAGTTLFVYNVAGQLIAEYTTIAAERNGTSYLTSDMLGTPRVITKPDGTVTSRHDYLPFGEEIGAGVGGRTTAQGYGQIDNVRQKFTGYERDGETGLDFAQARYYSNSFGRFTSPDPFMGSADLANPQSLNRYVYCLNNPLSLADPSGLDPTTWVHDIKKDLYFSVSAEDFNEKYKGKDGFEEVTNIGPAGLIIPLVTLEGSYAADPEYQMLRGSNVYLGDDGRFHDTAGEEVVQVDSEPAFPTTVFIWNPSWHHFPQSLGGHVSLGVDGRMYSWERNGWRGQGSPPSIKQYLDENRWRTGEAFVIDFGNPYMNANFRNGLKAGYDNVDNGIELPGFGGYNVIQNNCGESFSRTVNSMGLPWNTSIAPAGHRQYIETHLAPYIKSSYPIP